MDKCLSESTCLLLQLCFSSACSFVGGNVCGKWLQIVMAVIKMEKCLREMSPSKLSRLFFFFVDIGMNLANLVSFARWWELRRLSLRPLHII
jgi:hypothetical protein